MPVLGLGEETHDVRTLSRFCLDGPTRIRLGPLLRETVKLVILGHGKFAIIRGTGFKPLSPQINTKASTRVIWVGISDLLCDNQGSF